MEVCGDCGKPIGMLEASYYRKDHGADMGQTFHSKCGDPLGLQVKDQTIERLLTALRRIRSLAPKNVAKHAQKIARDALEQTVKPKDD